jgi:hypothetical protein
MTQELKEMVAVAQHPSVRLLVQTMHRVFRPKGFRGMTGEESLYMSGQSDMLESLVAFLSDPEQTLAPAPVTREPDLTYGVQEEGKV